MMSLEAIAETVKPQRMPPWQGYISVRAAKIVEIRPTELDYGNVVLLVLDPDDGTRMAVEVRRSFFLNNNVRLGGYFVENVHDQHQSYWSTEAFEASFTKP